MDLEVKILVDIFLTRFKAAIAPPHTIFLSAIKLYAHDLS